MLAGVFSLLLLAASVPHAAAEDDQQHVRVIHTQGLPKNAKYTPKPNATATYGTPLELNGKEPICQTVEGAQLCLPTPVQRRAAEQVPPLSIAPTCLRNHRRISCVGLLAGCGTGRS
jgi:hypothetical protein